MRRTLTAVLMASVIGCGTPAATAGPSLPLQTGTPARSIAAASPTPRVVEGAVLWALDRGPELTPDQDRLRVYLFATEDLSGNVRLIAPGGSTAAEVGIMGSGIFSADSCVSRVSTKQNGVRTIGAVQWSDAAQVAFLANPTAYRADVDLGFIKPGAGHVIARLADSGCRPR